MSWRLGVATGCCLDTPVLSVLDAAADAGVRGIELGTVPRHFDPWQTDEVQAVRDRLTARGLEAVSIHAPFGGILDLSAHDPHHRHAAMGAILSSVSALDHLEGRVVVVHPTDVPRHAGDVARRLANAGTSLATLGKACAALGVTLAVETPLPHLIGGHPDEFAWLLSRLDDHVGACIDTGHVWFVHGYWERFLRVIGPRLVHVHAHDHHGRFDDHLPPGDGSLDWDLIATSLRASAFAGWVILELSKPSEPLAEYFARAIAQAHRRLDSGGVA